MSPELRSQDREIEVRRRWYTVGRELYGLPDDEIARIYEVAKASGIALDDAFAVTLFAGARLGRTVDDVVRLATALPRDLSMTGRDAAMAIRTAAADVVGEVTAAAVAQVQARQAEMTRSVGDQVAEVAERVLQERGATDRKWRSLTLAAAVCLTATVALGVGYQLGSGAQATASNRMAAYAARPDAADWMRLIAANGDLSRSLAAYCRPGSPNYVRVNGGAPSCSLPLYLEVPPLPTQSAGGTGWITAADVRMQSLPWPTVLGLGIALAALWRMSRRRRAPIG